MGFLTMDLNSFYVLKGQKVRNVKKRARLHGPSQWALIDHEGAPYFRIFWLEFQNSDNKSINPVIHMIKVSNIYIQSRKNSWWNPLFMNHSVDSEILASLCRLVRTNFVFFSEQLFFCLKISAQKHRFKFCAILRFWCTHRTHQVKTPKK